MKKEISNKEDVRQLVDAFYAKVLKDEVIGYIFTEVVPISLEEHMPIMYRFWETVLLGEMSYKGNPMTKHLAMNEKEPLTKAHFDRWLSLFFETLDTHFEGEKVALAKQRAESIALLMQHKIQHQ
ncbi:MAG: group III truncated hemoglobin [Bacteroidetes bacterium]|nr:group III truncated hemoglobin [Bacteroidota bacterium]